MSDPAQELLDIVGRLLAGNNLRDGGKGGGALPTHSPALAKHLRQHHLLSLAHQAGVPGLKKDFIQCALINEMHFKTMEELGQAFLTRDLPWSVIKGGAYAWKIYEDSALRPMSDLDVLVRPEDFERAGKCLLDLGYAERSVSSRTRHAQTYCRDAHEVVDLHRSILQPFRSNSSMKRLWSRVTPSTRLPGCSELDPIDLTCVHLAHMARHEFSVPLVSYVDLKQLLAGLSATETRCLHDELARWRLDFAFAIAKKIMAQLSGHSRTAASARMRIVIPTRAELIACKHRSRPAQVAKKLALFPQDSVKLGVGWALRTAEDSLIAARR